MTHDMTDDSWYCPICLCDDATSKITLRCRHGFHAVCVGKHAATQKKRWGGLTTCPMCRDPVDTDRATAIFNGVVRYGTVDDVVACTVDGREIHRTTYNWGVSPLQMAASSGHLAMVAYLVQAGVDVNVRAKYGHTALYMAAMNGHLSVVKYLVDHGADIHLTRQGKTPLMVARDARQEHVAQYLYEVATATATA